LRVLARRAASLDRHLVQRGKSSASSGWGWGGSGAPPPQPPPHRRHRGGGAAGAIIAAIFFIAIVAAAVVFVLPRFLDDDADSSEDAESSEAPVAEATPPTPTPDATPTPPTDATPQPLVPDTTEQPRTDPDRSLERITWTVATPATTLEQLAQAWGIPRDTLVALNPKTSTTEPLAAGTHVVVHSGPITGSESVGPPNDGRLVGGIPFPEGRTWLLAPDRSRAFGTGETIVAVLAALDADAAKFPDAAPIQLGEISARKGGPIYGHQSHQAGRDIDIRLAVTKERDRFDPERNWFLIKTLIESGEVVKIFLNRSQQGWLRTAAEADVGIEAADRYFAIISHEQGHTIHIHVRFRCPDNDYRCVAYSLDETPAEVAKVLVKLPKGSGGANIVRKKGKLPVLRPKTKPRTPTKPTKPSGGKLPGK
jgi:murein endopeptidase